MKSKRHPSLEFHIGRLLGLCAVFMTLNLAAEPAHALPLCGALVSQPTSSADVYVQISAGAKHTLALRSDGTIAAWGNNGDGQCDVPALPTGLTYVEVSAGGGVRFDFTDNEVYDFGFSVARRSDGSVVQWGYTWGVVPPLPTGLSYVEIDAGNAHTLARRSDGSVVAWGENGSGQCDVPVLAAGLSFSEISAGGYLHMISYETWFWPFYFIDAHLYGHSFARLSDGSIVKFGWSQGALPALPAGLSYVEVSTGSTHTVARRSDGSVVQWTDHGGGSYWNALADVPVLSPGLSYVELDAGARHTVARVSDGSLVAWGDNQYGQCNVPTPPTGLDHVEISAGGATSTSSFMVNRVWNTWVANSGHSVAQLSDGSLVAWGNNSHGQCNVPGGALGLNRCFSATNSSGTAAVMSASGSASLAANDLTISAVGLPDTTFLFFHGSAQQQVPFGDGHLCVAGALVRIGTASLASGGLATSMLDLPSVGITNPGVHFFQCFFRDTAPGGTGFNLSDALEVTFAP
ncbi:MAG: hypothetical protein ACI835_005734 [Planctomycetota bacterium]|jgi:hypothetical protein